MPVPPWGTYKFTDTKTLEGQTLVCDMDWERGYPETRDEPGQPDIAELTSVLLNGVEIFDLLSAEAIAKIEAVAADQMVAQAQADAEAYADSLRDQRRDDELTGDL